MCCSCPCVKEQDCPYIKHLKKDVKKNLQELRGLVCNKAERKFYCCRSNNQDPAPSSVDIKPKVVNVISSSCDKDDENCFTYLPSAGLFLATKYQFFEDLLSNIFSEKGQCGYPSKVPPSNIIGGKKTTPGRYSYTALLGYEDNNEV